MPKILRLHKSGSNDASGWSVTSKIGLKEADEILDPESGRVTNAAVSIPSPFARLHLVETALDFVRKRPNEVSSVYHKMVSQFWDLWEITFNYHQHAAARQSLRIHQWNKSNELDKLNTATSTRRVAKVLELYSNDGAFAQVNEIALIFWSRPDGKPYLLGGTSPLTLLFPAPDLRPLIRQDGSVLQRTQGGGAYFDSEYVSIENREDAFRKYIYHLFAFDPELSTGKKAKYVLNILDNSQLQALKMSSVTDLDQTYGILPDFKKNPVYIGNQPLRIRPDESIISTSDFFIKPSRIFPDGKKLPLVLRPELKAPGKKYFNDTPWDTSTKVPVSDPLPLHERSLPGKGFLHPYLTVNDLLTDTLLSVPYELDNSKFHTGQVNYKHGAKQKQGALLPIKPIYFEYFEPKELTEHLIIDFEPGCVRVTLRIPIMGGGTVDFERAYYEDPKLPELGRLRNTNAAITIFPFVKAHEASQYNDFYKVMLVDSNKEPTLINKELELRFWVDNQLITPDGTERSATGYRRTSKTQGNGSTYYEIRKTHFEFLEVLSPSPADGSGLVVPKWIEKAPGTKEFRFAVDFGTTNTHIAWNSGEAMHPEPFNFGRADSPVVMLKKPSDDTSLSEYNRLFHGIESDPRPGAPIGISALGSTLEREFIPPYIGASDSPYAFPIRTATCESPEFSSITRSVREPNVLGTVNIGFGINSETNVYRHYNTNLKWQHSLNEENRQRVRAFFRELLLLFRAKVILNDGDVPATRLIWFAPLSFSDYAKNLYRDEWDSLFQEIFHTNALTTHLTESAAPYYYLTKTGKVTSVSGENAVFVDIGGGSTDVLLFANREPVLSTSFRFAGNDLWGDGAAPIAMAKDNGLVRFGVDYTTEHNRPPYLKAALDNPSFSSADVASILFANKDQSGFEDRLRRAHHLRVLLYLHFGALVYHVGQLVQLSQHAIPRYLCLTGRGSLYVRLLSAGPDMKAVEKLARTILKKVTGQEPPVNFKIILADDPKQTTANGGVLVDNNSSHTGDEAESTGMVVRPIGTGLLTAREREPIQANQVTEEIKMQVLSNTRDCLRLLLEDAEVTSQQENLGIRNEPGRVMAILEPLLADSFNMCLEQYASLPEGQPIPETLFFLPLKQSLYELSKQLT